MVIHLGHPLWEKWPSWEDNMYKVFDVCLMCRGIITCKINSFLNMCGRCLMWDEGHIIEHNIKSRGEDVTFQFKSNCLRIIVLLKSGNLLLFWFYIYFYEWDMLPFCHIWPNLMKFPKANSYGGPFVKLIIWPFHYIIVKYIKFENYSVGKYLYCIEY